MRLKIFTNITLALFFIVILTACEKSWEKKIEDYPNTTWKSYNPYLEINVDKDGICKAKLEYNNQIIEAEMDTRANVIICFNVDNNDSSKEIIYFRGSCMYKKDRCVINIKKSKDNLFNEKKRIVLIKE